ncbi:MAG: hypothetical protein IPL52_14290 [Flavobacteriales bacterium]|nr:hypothetical protein [Flavobacteriales bacterium]
MPRRIALIALAVHVFVGLLRAQDRNRNWLNYNNWLQFGPLGATNVPNLDTATVGASLSDTSGQLLVYTAGYGAGGIPAGIRGPDHQLIANQPGQWCLLNSMSAVQGNIFIPKPGDPDRTFLCTWYYYNLTPGFARHWGILEVDLGIASGIPAVLDTGYTWFLENASCKRMVVPHVNGEDYWFVTQPIGTDLFHAYAVTSAGIVATPVISQAGTLMPVDWFHGKMIPNSAGDRFVSVMEPMNSSIPIPPRRSQSSSSSIARQERCSTY